MAEAGIRPGLSLLNLLVLLPMFVDSHAVKQSHLHFFFAFLPFYAHEPHHKANIYPFFHGDTSPKNWALHSSFIYPRFFFLEAPFCYRRTKTANSKAAVVIATSRVSSQLGFETVRDEKAIGKYTDNAVLEAYRLDLDRLDRKPLQYP